MKNQREKKKKQEERKKKRKEGQKKENREEERKSVSAWIQMAQFGVLHSLSHRPPASLALKHSLTDVAFFYSALSSPLLPPITYHYFHKRRASRP